MKTTIFISFFMMLGFTTKAQEIYFLDNIQKELIRGKEYNIQLVNIANQVEDFIIESDNGTIEKVKSGNYKIRPNKKGILTLTINKKKDTLISKNYRVREIVFYAYIIGFEESIRDLNRFATSSGLYMNSDDLVCSDITHTGKYELIIIKKNNTFYKTASDELNWSNETKEKFKQLENGDLIFIYNISFKIGDDIYEANPFSLEVKI